MARWQLINAHYLNIEGTQWEYKEMNRSTGRQERKVFAVPRYLDPNDPQDWTHKDNQDEGRIIVSDGNGADPKDIVFTGQPTPDMLPIDDDARAISDSYKGRWTHPIEGLPTFSQSLLGDLQARMAAATAEGPRAEPTKEITEALTAISAAMKQNTEILAELAKSRRV